MVNLRNKKKLVIADPSFENWVGHHAPYDFAIIEAAKDEWIPIVWAAKKVKTDLVSKSKYVRQIYSTSAWGKRFALKEKPSIILLAVRVVFYSLLFVLKKLFFILIGLKTHLRFVSELLRLLLPPLIYDGIRYPRKYTMFFIPPCIIWIINSLTPPFVKGFYTHKRWWILNFIPPLFQDILKVLSTNKFSLFPSFFWQYFLGSSRNQYIETLKAIKNDGLIHGDVIFCHMITGYNYLVWALVAKYCKKKGIIVKILFRYPTSFIPIKRIDIRIANRIFESISAKGVVEFFTDSVILTADYKNLIKIPIRTLPIPHIPAYIKDIKPADSNFVNVMVLGNARAEKGFCEIVDCIDRIIRSSNQKFKFFLQANDPDEQAKNSIEKLKLLASPNLVVYNQALDEDKYSELLRQAAIVLLPYHADVYGARTSGVLVEAIASGKIVIVSKNSWLAKEVEAHGSGVIIRDRSSIDIEFALDDIYTNYKSFQEKAQIKAIAYQKLHGSGPFVNCLLGDGKFNLNSLNRNVVIVFPFSDFFQQSSGATVRTGLLCRYLISNGLDVSVVLPNQTTNVPHSNLNGVKFYEYEEKISLRGYFSSLKTKFALFGNRYRETWYENRFCQNTGNINFDRALAKAIDDCSFVIAEYPFDYQNIISKTSIYGNSTCITFHDLMGIFVKEKKTKKQIERLELAAAREFDYVVTVANYEQQYFNSVGIDNILIPNPCEISYSSQVFMKKLPKEFSYLKKFVLFVGSNHLPNINAAISLRKTAEYLALNDEKINIVVCGSCMAPEKIGNFISLGVVDQRLLDILMQEAMMIVCPLESGTGMSLKVIQAFSYGKIVLGTRDAFRGIPVENLLDCFVDDDIRNYHNKIRLIINDIWRYRYMKTNAYEISKKFDFRIQFESYRKMIESNVLISNQQS